MLHRRILLLCPPLVLLALLLWWKSQEHSTTTASSTSVSATNLLAEAPSTEGVLAFEDWRKTHPGKQLDEAVLAEGLRLATARRQQMRELIARDPARALEEAVTRSEYESLPEALKPLFEKPFNSVATLQVLPVCGQHGKHEHAAGESHGDIHSLLMDGRSFEASVYGQRLAQGTKEGTPLSGITLDNLAAISELPLEVPSAEDLAALSILPIANPDPTRDFATGELLGGHPVTALAGGRLFLFRNLETLETFNRRLAKLDETPGPHGGSSYVVSAKVAADGAAGDGTAFDWQDAEQQAQVAASTWTETTKSVFFIRVDFSDVPGEAVTQAALANVINTSVSDCIEQMSYNKTSLNATVSATTVRLPQTSTYYKTNNRYNQLLADAKTAYASTPGAVSLSGFNIVGVHFPDIDMTSTTGGVPFAGLATVGGSDHWLQGTTNPGVIIHEFGHNYGLSHASYWNSTDDTVEEYGDVFDIMGDGPEPAGHFHPQGKSKLNWLTTAQWFDASSSANSGVRRIYRFDDAATSGTLRAIRVKKSSTDFYWVGYRPGITGNAWLNNGAYLIWERPSLTRSCLLDTTPGTTNGKNDSAIDIGTTYSDTTAISPVYITPIAKGGSGADAWLDVNVQIGPVGNQAPTASITLPASLDARKPLIFTASANDPNGDTLAYEWDFGDNSPSANASAIQHTWMVGGNYTVKLTVSDMKGGKATTTANVTVSDPFTQAWTQRTSGTTGVLRDVTVGGGKVVAVGGSSGNSGLTCVTANGSTWSATTFSINVRFTGVIYDGAKFVASGYEWTGSVWQGMIYTSPDAVTWTRRLFSGGSLNDIAFGGGVYVAVGENGAIWSSTNGTSWSPESSGISLDIQGVSYGNGVFVAVGDDNDTGGSGFVLKSLNGSSWTNTTSGAVGLASWHGFYKVQYCNDRFLGSGWYSKIRYSTDGGSTFPTNESGTRQIEGFAYGNGTYLAAGVNKDASDADINLISMDGMNWSPLTTATQDDCNSAVFFNNTFITVGDNGSIWQSPAFTAAAPTYTSWAASNFAGNPPLSGPNADYDGDGVTNLGEYATGTNPRNSTSRVNFTSTRANGELTLTVPKAANVSDVIFSAQYSTDMVNWSSAGVTIVENSASQIVAKIPSATGKGFLRVVFDVAP